MVAAEAAAQPAGDPPPDPIGWPEPDPAPPAPDPVVPPTPPTTPDAAPPPAAPEPVAAPFAPEKILPARLELEPPLDYPRAFVERPLLLPPGAFSVSMDARVVETFIGNPNSVVSVATRPDLEVGFETLELDAGAEVLLGRSLPENTPPQDTEHISALFLGIEKYVGTRHALAFALRVEQPFADTSTYSPRIGLLGKRRLGAACAVSYTILAALERRATNPSNGGNVVDEDTVFATWALQLQAQVSPNVALAARAELDLVDHLDEMPNVPGSYFLQSYGARVLVSATPGVDVFLGADLLGPSDFKAFVVGFTARKVP